MEMMIRAKEKYGGILTMSFLLEKFKDEKNEFLEKL